MAKIMNGPLAAGISGSIGNITFEQTRFGQVVQGKPVPPYPGSPGQQASIDRFRKAMRGYSQLHWHVQNLLTQLAARDGDTPHGKWIKAYTAYLKTGLWSPPWATLPSLRPKILSFYYDAPWHRITTDLDGHIPTIWIQTVVIIAGTVVTKDAGWSASPLVIPPAHLFTYPMPPQISIIIFPFFAYLTPEQYGISQTATLE